MTQRTFRFERPLQMSNAFNRGFEIFKANAGLLIGASFLMGICMFAAQMIVGSPRLGLQMLGGRNQGAAMLLASAYNLLIETPAQWLGAGMLMYPVMRLALRMHDGHKVEFNDLFQKFPVHLRYGLGSMAISLCMLPVYLIIFGIVAGLVAVGVIATGGSGGAIILTAVLICMAIALPLFILSLPFQWLYPFILVDNPDIGVWRCVQLTIQAVWKNLFRMALVCFCALLIGSAGVILCIIGIVLTAPLFSTIMAAAYRQIAPVEDLTPEQMKQAKIAALEREQEGYIENDGGWDEGTKKQP